MYFPNCSLILIVLLIVLNFTHCLRTIRTNLNPGCKEDTSCKNSIDTVNLIHSTSREDDLTLNFLSTTVNKYPEFLIVPNKQVTIGWYSLLMSYNFGTLSLTDKPENAIDILITEWPVPSNFVRGDIKWTRLSTNCGPQECQTETEGFYDDQRSVTFKTRISSTEFSAKNLQIGPDTMLIEFIMNNFTRLEISKSEFRLSLFNFARKKIELDRVDDYERMQLKDEEESFFANSSFFQWMTSASAIKDGVEIRRIHLHDADVTTSTNSEYRRLASGIFKEGVPLRTIRISFDDPDIDVNFQDEMYDSVSWSFTIGLGQAPEAFSPQPSSSPMISRSTLIGLIGAAIFVLIVATIIGGIIIVQRRGSFGVSDVSYKYIVSRSSLLDQKTQDP
ncbi:uncharacterized protein LOC141851133 [Brevipalpus obovatus]|uniref:uncharacterized protein LOC141851133 n=1 Tax=Brevipalpus obovatus TaxID=246614 RepID=UPI003D9F8AF2